MRSYSFRCVVNHLADFMLFSWYRLTSVLVSRFLLDLRSAASNSADADTDVSSLRSSLIRFATGNIGEELEIEGSTWNTGAGDHLHQAVEDRPVELEEPLGRPDCVAGRRELSKA